MAETWVLNESITFPSSSINTEINFTSNGTAFVYIRIVPAASNSGIHYCTSTDLFSGYVNVYDRHGWTNAAYCTVVFDTAPTGDLLTWLQANGTKQAEPEPTTPKNACLIDGTGYSIKRGKALIGGTGYGISRGRTLVDGTGYNIILSKKTISLTISGVIIRDGSYGSYVQVGDTKYNAVGEYEIESGATITIAAGAARNSYLSSTYILLNGTRYESSDPGIMATCSFESETNVQVQYYQRNSGVRAYNYAHVTTD